MLHPNRSGHSRWTRWTDGQMDGQIGRRTDRRTKMCQAIFGLDPDSIGGGVVGVGSGQWVVGVWICGLDSGCLYEYYAGMS